jgi:hypothetical protein
MSEQRQDAAAIEQRYVAEHDDDQALVEGLDPAKDRDEKTTDKVEASGDHVDQDVEQMADPDR